MNFNDREKIIALTPLWKGERLPDGRPKVADKYLDALYEMTLEEVWKPIFVLGYEHQFVGGGEAPLQTLHDITSFGGAVCLPGDVVFGAGGGVLFIPSHLVADVVEGAAKTHVKDDFGFEMICQGKFTTAQIDKNTWSEDMLDMLLDWIKNDPRGEAYRDLDWSKEYDLARNGDPNDTQTAL